MRFKLSYREKRLIQKETRRGPEDEAGGGEERVHWRTQQGLTGTGEIRPFRKECEKVLWDTCQGRLKRKPNTAKFKYRNAYAWLAPQGHSSGSPIS